MKNNNHITADLLKDCGQRLKKCRLALDLSQDAIAQICNVNRTAYTHWEAGNRQIALKAMIQLKQTFGITADYILTGDASAMPNDLRDIIIKNQSA